MYNTDPDIVTGVWSPIGDFCEEYFISKAKELNVKQLVIGILQTETQFFCYWIFRKSNWRTWINYGQTFPTTVNKRL